MRALFLVVLVAACDSGRSKAPPKPEQMTPAARAPADASVATKPPLAPGAVEYVKMAYETHCKDDSDCSMTNQRADGECCGSCDERFAYDKATYAAMRSALDARCPKRCSVDCPRAETDDWSKCVDGACVVERKAWTGLCKTDDDCVFWEFNDETDCCGRPCGGIEHVMNKTELAGREKARSAYCAEHEQRCSEKDCDRPPDEGRPICDDGRCAQRLPNGATLRK